MNTNLLITPSRVIELAFSKLEMISADSIRQSKIDVAQEYFIRPMLGDVLFEQVLLGQHSLFANTFLQPALAHYVRYGIIGELSVQIGDSGAVVYQNERADNTRNNTQDSTSSAEQILSRNENQDAQIVSNSDSKRTDLKISDNQQTQNLNDKRTTVDSAEASVDQTTQQTTTKTQEETHESHDTSSLSQYDKIEAMTATSTGQDTNNDKVVASGSQKQTSSDDKTSTLSVDTISRTTGFGQDDITTTELGKEQELHNKNLEVTQNSGDTKQSTVIDSQMSRQSRTVLRPATDFQRQVIMQRAMFDANVLMAKAIRYVRANPAEFPDYKPTIGMRGGMGLGRIVL